ncbi:hypothetical protein BGZ80_011157 [Entomortierella chlamydospora]|uniref:FAD-binding domain-containing protein n=1 Tax=Entomortierella chlamydospora TaxID=101097 RepID=A0A9P6SZ81_9FUNG|nr:hypothetical protein BGZ80_011157 [Entomortierella chlamydospora]
MEIYDSKLNELGSMSTKFHKISTGYDQIILARPKLYDLLRRQVPAHKISMGKKVIRAKEHDSKVTAYCSDNTVYEGSILVGADGAYSAVRQNMYKQLEEEGKLPLRDKDAFSVGYIAMVGISNPSNPERYPQLSETHRTHFRLVLGDNSDSCYVATAPENQICWGIQLQLPEEKAREQKVRSSEWGSESVEVMIKQFQDLPCAFGGTMKEIFDATPRDLMSKVFLEEKVFQTWYHGRTVLIGDACHKLLPGAGQGAVTAMKDAVVLANSIFNMKDRSDQSVKRAFASYYGQCYQEAEVLTKSSALLTKMMFGHNWSDRLLRRVVISSLTDWLKQREASKNMQSRPQVNWLPLKKNRGSGNVLQPEGREEAEKKAQAQAQARARADGEHYHRSRL